MIHIKDASLTQNAAFLPFSFGIVFSRQRNSTDSKQHEERCQKKKLKVVINEDKFLSPKQCRRKGEAYFHGLSVHCDTVNSIVSIDLRRDR